MRPLLLWLVLTLLCGSRLIADEPAKPLLRAHAHNDYAHPRPLIDALDAGFCSVEADIHLIDGALLVAHDRDKVKVDRTLQALYLDPLKKRITRHGGSVYPGEKALPFSLLIDLKSKGEPTYLALHDVLAKYAGILTSFEGDRVHPRAITVIISGNRPRELMQKQKVRYAGYDGRLSDLDGNSQAAFMPWISDNFGRHFKWRGQGAMLEEDRKKLADIVARTHKAGKKLRLWAAPDGPAAWNVLHDAGVDLINTDKLSELQAFLLKKDTGAPEAKTKSGESDK